MWTKKVVSLLLTVAALLVLLTACATTDGKHPLRHEPAPLPADHKPHRLGGEWPN
jgi:hypothetical protein